LKCRTAKSGAKDDSKERMARLPVRARLSHALVMVL
jgi:hypothetical protein